MYKRFFILVFCLFLLGGCLAAKAKNGKKRPSDEDYLKSNTMSREDNERHVRVRPGGVTQPGGVIDIDETHEGDVIEGSAVGKQEDDLDHSGHGLGVDDEDDDEGSATAPPDSRTECQRLRDQLNKGLLLGAYVPECSSTGDFEPIQCSGGTGYCWCVDFEGREIKDTKTRAPHKPVCSQVETPAVNKAVLPPTDEEEHPNIIEKSHVDKDKSEQNPGYSVTDHSEDGSKTEVSTIDPSLSNVVPGAEDAKVEPSGRNEGAMLGSKQEKTDSVMELMSHPGVMAGIIGGAVVGLLCAILLVMFIVYRMRKKDEGSYALDEPKRSPPINSYSRSTNREFYA